MQKEIFFENENGLRLCGVLSNPTNDSAAPIVVLCHGFVTDKGGLTFVALEKALNDENISTFRFDFFGHGESAGKFEDITITREKLDIFATIKFLKSSGFSKIALVGSSSGGGAAIMAAAEIPDLFALVLKAPAVDHLELEIAERGREGIARWKKDGSVIYERSNGEKFKLNYSFFEDLKNNIGFDVADKIAAPTLIVHGDADRDVPILQSIEAQKLIPDCRLEVFPGADHKFTKSEDFEMMIKMISEFIIKSA